MYNAELLDRDDSASGRWRVSSAGHQPIIWESFAAGPVVLDDQELDHISQQLLGLPLAAVAAAATAEITPFIAGDEPAPALLLHSATSSTKGFEGDLTDVREGRAPWDVPGYLEARVIALAKPGDLAIGRTGPWREAVLANKVDHLVLPDLDHYYLSQALLVAACAPERLGPQLTALVEWIQARPEAVVRLYALDREMQIFLTWLRRQAGLSTIRIDANNPVVSDRWNQKSHIHPTVSAARQFPAGDGSPDPHARLRSEQRHSAGHQRLEMTIPVLPGYTVERRGRSPEEFGAGLLEAAQLLRSRYSLVRGCLKPSEAGDGARIVPGLDLENTERLQAETALAYHHGDDYLLEAHVEFSTFEVAGGRFILSPSGHIRNGHVAPGLTVQLMHGQSWAGNAYIDADSCAEIGLSVADYQDLRAGLEGIQAAFRSPAAERDGSHAGLVTGGIDFAVGRVGGDFGDEIITGAIDFNLSSHGAEYLRAFLDEVWPEGHRYAATRVYRPARSTGLIETDAAVQAYCPAGQRVATVAAVPGSWGMVAATGTGTRSSIQNVESLLAHLVGLGLTVD
jgi:hypothetical protein